MKNKNLPPLISRQYQFDIQAQERDNGHTIYGRPIVYESPTDIGGYFREVIHKGALDETDLRDVRFLVNHDQKGIPLARSRNNNANSTMRFTIGENGAEIAVDLDTENNVNARALYSSVERGDISGMSFLFSVAEERWEGLDTDYPTRHIDKIRSVVEVSAVTWPAYNSTEIQARSLEALENAKKAMEIAKQTEQRSTEDDLELEKLKSHYLYKI